MDKKVENKITLNLRQQLELKLSKLIDGDYVLWDVPYYSNIGDILIWRGTIDILKKLSFRCIEQSSKETCRFPKLPSKAVILLSGGGNFGDLYPVHQHFKNEVIKRYPDNKIIVLPQSIWYESEEAKDKDFAIFKKHKKLVICVRDHYSYDILARELPGKVEILPDMAFGLGVEAECKPNYKEKILFLKRRDLELSEDVSYNGLEIENVEVRDWPTFESSPFYQKIMYGLVHCSMRWKSNSMKRITDFYGNFFYRPLMVRTGIKFLSQYTKIYTTRLHVMILGYLLGKEIYFIDNITGKLSAFSNTWLKDAKNVRPYIVK